MRFNALICLPNWYATISPGTVILHLAISDSAQFLPASTVEERIVEHFTLSLSVCQQIERRQRDGFHSQDNFTGNWSGGRAGGGSHTPTACGVGVSVNLKPFETMSVCICNLLDYLA